MLTGDQNIIDIAYQVRWNIRDPELYLFELAQPDDTIQPGRRKRDARGRRAGHAATTRSATGAARSRARVAEEMQQHARHLSAPASLIQGVAIKQADPPAAVNDAFKEVTAAQQEAQSYINQANAYALQLTQKAQGEATAFDKVYEQYRLAPGGDQAPHVLRDDGARAAEGRQDDRRGARASTAYLPLGNRSSSARPGAGAGQ